MEYSSGMTEASSWGLQLAGRCGHSQAEDERIRREASDEVDEGSGSKRALSTKENPNVSLAP